MAPPGEGEDPKPNETQVSSSQMNGILDGGGNEPWDRVWSIDEMRSSANDWSLACDAGMLRYLQDFSQRMISRTHEIQGQVNSLVHEAKQTDVRVNNAFNDFIMLANTQFVENRVYDEDVAQEETNNEKKDEQEKTKEQREAELIPKISEAMRLGMSVIDTAFEKLDIDEANSDSDDEGDSPYKTDPILEPKDPYIHRPLPYLIGSQSFMQDDDVGLVDLPSEPEESDHGSISDSDEESQSESESSSGESDDSEDEKPKRTSQSQKQRQMFDSDSGSDSESGSDLFGEEKKSESSDDEDDKGNEQEPKSFADELAAKISGASAPKPAETKEKKEKKAEGEKKERSKSKSKQKPTPDEDDLFGAPPEDDEFSAFGKSGGLFSTSKGLFDDDADDGGGLFDDVISEKKKKDEDEEPEEVPAKKGESRPRAKSGKAMPAGAVSIFGAGADDLFSSSIKKKTDSSSDEEEEVVPKKEAAKKPAPSGGGLFDVEDDDLFSVTPAQKEPKKQSKPASKPAVDLFGGDSSSEEEGDLFATVSSKPEKKSTPVEPKTADEPPKKKLPAGAVSMFGGAPNPLAAALKAQHPPSDKEEEDDWSDEDKQSHASSTSKSSLTAPSGGKAGKKSPSPSPSSSSLFAEEPEDDLFASKPAAKPSDSKAKSKSAGKAGGSGLFGREDDDEDEDLFSITSKPAKKAGDKPAPRAASLLFEDEQEEEGDLFGSSAHAAAVPPTSKPAESGKKKPVGGVSLFGDSGADLFAETKKKITKEAPKNEEKAVTKESVKEQEPSTPRKMTLSLFDDNESEEDGDLFAAPSMKTKDTKSEEQDSARKPRAKSKMLFEDEDVLFGGTPAESPPVDLFAPGSPVSPTKDAAPPNLTPDKPKVAIKGATTSASTTDIFTQSGSDEDDGDLFGSSAKKTPLSAKSTAPAAPPQKKVDVKGATLTESSTDKSLFVDKSDSDEDIFASKKQAPQPQEEVKPKKPPGAVSMFGGVDIAAAMKKRADSLSPEGKPDTETDPLATSPESPPSKPTGWKPVVPPAAGKKPTAPQPADKPVPKPTVGQPAQEKPSMPPGGKERTKIGGIGKLQANLAINPAALLPGAAPPMKEEKPEAVGFDQPVEASTLRTAQKDRAKIQTKRRPPTRQARRAAVQAAQSEDMFSDSMATLSGVTMDTTDAKMPSGGKAPSGETKPKQDLFGNDDMFGANAPSASKSTGAIPKSTSKTQNPLTTVKDKPDKETVKIPPMDDEEDLFSSGKTGSAKTESKSSKTQVPPDIDDDIFSSAPKSTLNKKVNEHTKIEDDDGLFTSSSKPKKPAPTMSAVPMFEPPPLDDDDDVFSSGSKKKKSAIAQVLDDDDDIFGGSSVSSAVTKTTSTLKATADDDDDIFANSTINKPKEKSKVAVIDDDDIFGSASVPSAPKSDKDKPSIEDDSDIFASEPPKGTKRPKKAKTKDEDLFKDDTDIFADLPASKPKEKKAKTKKAESKSIFKDDVDDIFAESASKPKTKKSTKKKATSGTSSEAAADIFDTEAPNIFDDPLSAMK